FEHACTVSNHEGRLISPAVWNLTECLPASSAKARDPYRGVINRTRWQTIFATRHPRLMSPGPPCALRTRPGRPWSGLAGLRRAHRLRLHRRHGAERDREAVPGVDGCDQHREVDGLGLGEMRTNLLIDILRRVGVGYQRHRLRPGERRALAIGVGGRLAPGVQQIEPLLGLAVL